MMISDTLESISGWTTATNQTETIQRLRQDRADLLSQLRELSHENSVLRHMESHLRAWVEGSTELDSYHLQKLFNVLDSLRG
jgi:regulator of replication initiation timing